MESLIWIKPRRLITAMQLIGSNQKRRFFILFFFNYVGSFAFLFIIITYTKIKECLVNKI